MQLIELTVDGELRQVEPGTTLSEIAQSSDKAFVSCAVVGEELAELSYRVMKPANIRLLSADEDDEASRVYFRGLVLLMQRAARELYGQADVALEYALNAGVFCRLCGAESTADNVQKLKQKICQYIEEDSSIEKSIWKTSDVLTYFKQTGRADKAQALAYRKHSTHLLYTSGGFSSYYYGIMPSRTGVIKQFDLKPYRDGMMLSYPTPYTYCDVLKDQPKFAQAFDLSQKWADILNASTVADLNHKLESGEFAEFIQINEALHSQQLARLCRDIAARPKTRIILIAGPSSSGKTTFANRLRINMGVYGKKCYVVSLDDYYLERDTRVPDENGKIDFECLEALDLPVLNRDLNNLLAGKQVTLPRYDFESGTRQRGKDVCLKPGEMLIIEGIHGLNKRLTGDIPDETLFKIFLSPLSPLNLDRENIIFPEDIRLLRRLVRDKLSRGRDFLTTLEKWSEVREGEHRYILPYLENADVIFNTTLLYEVSILKKYAYDELKWLKTQSVQARYLYKFLNYFSSSDLERVIPIDSILREFIGGNVFYQDE